MNDVRLICLQSWVPIRAKPSSASEMVTALLFGETCLCIDEEEDGWLKVKTSHDQYPGFIPKNYVYRFSDYAHLQWKMVTEPYTYLKGTFSAIQLSPGSKVPVNHQLIIDGQIYDWRSSLGEKKIVNLLEHAKWFLNTPYLWGGRSIFGIDCSGLVQVIGQMNHINMPRDASQQVLVGNKVMWQARQPGDLCYFENASGKVTHVGIIFTPNTIIHASGKVRIDELTPEGIIHLQTKELTHKLCDIRTWNR